MVTKLLLERGVFNRIVRTILCQFYTILIDLWSECVSVCFVLLFMLSQPLVFLFDHFGVIV